MALSVLKTGQSLSVVKADGSALNRIRVELSWNESGPKSPYDFDVFALEVNQNAGSPGIGKGVGESRVCYFNQKQTPAIVHSGDNRTGAGDGPDETLIIDLSKVDSVTNLIPVVITLYEGPQRGQDFQQTQGAEAVLVNDETGERLALVKLADLAQGSTGAVIAALDKSSGAWKFTAVNQGFPGKQIGDFFTLYGF